MISLFRLHKKLSCRCSFDLSQRDESNEHHKILFCRKDKDVILNYGIVYASIFIHKV